MKLQHVQYFTQKKFAGKQVEITCRTKMWRPRIDATYIVSADEVQFKELETHTSIQFYVPNMRMHVHSSEKSIVSIREHA